MGTTASKPDDQVLERGIVCASEDQVAQGGASLSPRELEAITGMKQLGAMEEGEAPSNAGSKATGKRGRKRKAPAPPPPSLPETPSEELVLPEQKAVTPYVFPVNGGSKEIVQGEGEDAQVVTVTWTFAHPYGGNNGSEIHQYNDFVVPESYYIPAPRTKKKLQTVSRRLHQRPWAIKEVKALLDGVAKCGEGHWSAIKKLAFPKSDYRTAVDLKDKWRNLVKASKLPRQKVKPEKNGNKQRWAAIPTPILKRVKDLVAEQEANAVGASPRKKGRPKRPSTTERAE